MSETITHTRRPKKLSTLTIVPLLAFFFSTAALNSPINAPARSTSSLDEVMQLRTYITGYAQNFLGLRYRYAGRSPMTGFDCSGFTSYILGEFAVKVSASSATQSKQGKKIAFSNVQPGDLLFFGRRGAIQHVAMVVENTEEGIYAVHSTCTRGIIVENINKSSYWKPRLLYARDVISEQVQLPFADMLL